MQHLPLKVDFQENEAIVKCFYGLYRLRHEKLIMILPNVIKIIIHIYHNKQTSNDSKFSKIHNEYFTILSLKF